jgi:hypothetical protein
MQKITLLAILAASAWMAGCSTYKPSTGAGPGFSEMQVDANVYRVSFRGDGATKTDQAEEMALLRCAEVMAEKGFPFFTIQSDQAFASAKNFTNPIHVKVRENKATVTGGNSVTINIPSVVKTIVGIHERPAAGFAYNTQQIISSLGPKYRK